MIIYILKFQVPKSLSFVIFEIVKRTFKFDFVGEMLP